MMLTSSLLVSTLCVLGKTPAQLAAAMLKKMSLGEKVSLLHGGLSRGENRYVGNTPEIVNESSGVRIPPLNLNDGPQGFRDGGSTCWPCTLGVGATWDRNLSLAWGQSMGKEFYDKGANVQVGRCRQCASVRCGIMNVLCPLRVATLFSWSDCRDLIVVV